MGIVKNLFRSLWGVSEPESQFSPPIECEACTTARAAGRDACPEHHTHHAHSRRDGGASASEKSGA